MAGKKKDLQLQIEIKTDEDWASLLEKEGLVVVDIYSEWCGPCTGLLGNLKKAKMELGEELTLAMAKSDDITALESFRNKSEPTWLFIAGGQPVKLLYGANAPLLTRTIFSELEEEKHCLEDKSIPRKKIKLIREINPEEKKLMVELQGPDDDEELVAENLNELREKASLRLLNLLKMYGIFVIQPFINAKPDIRKEIAKHLDLCGLTVKGERCHQLTSQEVGQLWPSGDEENYVPVPGTEEKSHEPEELEEEDDTTTEEEKLQKAEMKRKFKLRINFTSAWTRTECRAMYVKFEGSGKICPEPTLQKLLGVGPCTTLKETHPECLIAHMGKNNLLMGIWLPETDQKKKAAFRMFFPELVAELVPPPPLQQLKKILMIFNIEKKGDVMTKVDELGNQILDSTELVLNEEMANQLLLPTEGGAEGAEEEMMTDEERAAKEEIIESIKGTNILMLAVRRASSGPMIQLQEYEPLYVSKDYILGQKEVALFFPDLPDEELIPKERPAEPEPEPEEAESISEEEVDPQDIAQHIVSDLLADVVGESATTVVTKIIGGVLTDVVGEPDADQPAPSARRMSVPVLQPSEGRKGSVRRTSLPILESTASTEAGTAKESVLETEDMAVLPEIGTQGSEIKESVHVTEEDVAKASESKQEESIPKTEESPDDTGASGAQESEKRLTRSTTDATEAPEESPQPQEARETEEGNRQAAANGSQADAVGVEETISETSRVQEASPSEPTVT